jgi:hypothetical protein
MKIFLLAITFFAGISAAAQISKGSHFLGGDVSFGSSDNKTIDLNNNQSYSKYSSFNFYPSLDWVFKDNMVAGARILLSFYSYNYKQTSSGNNTKQNNIGASIYVRKYLPLGKSFFLFGDASLGGQSNYSKQINRATQNYYSIVKGYSINAMIYPGISYQVNKSLFLDVALNNLVTLGYIRTNADQKVENLPNYKYVKNSFNFSSSLGFGVPLQIGMRWMIAKK